MTSLYKGQNVDFIVATHGDDTGALSRVSAISSAFPLARIVVVDSSKSAHKQASRLKETIESLGKQASYVDCDVNCTYTCYQQALAHVQGDYLVFRTTDKLWDENITAAGFTEEFDEDLVMLETATAEATLDKALFKRDFITSHAPFSQPGGFDETAFLAQVQKHAKCRVVSAAA